MGRGMLDSVRDARPGLFAEWSVGRDMAFTKRGSTRMNCTFQFVLEIDNLSDVMLYVSGADQKDRESICGVSAHAGIRR
jgi:hypothetical protein